MKDSRLRPTRGSAPNRARTPSMQPSTIDASIALGPVSAWLHEWHLCDTVACNNSIFPFRCPLRRFDNGADSHRLETQVSLARWPNASQELMGIYTDRQAVPKDACCGEQCLNCVLRHLFPAVPRMYERVSCLTSVGLTWTCCRWIDERRHNLRNPCV